VAPIQRPRRFNCFRCDQIRASRLFCPRISKLGRPRLFTTGAGQLLDLHLQRRGSCVVLTSEWRSCDLVSILFVPFRTYHLVKRPPTNIGNLVHNKGTSDNPRFPTPPSSSHRPEGALDYWLLARRCWDTRPMASCRYGRRYPKGEPHPVGSQCLARTSVPDGYAGTERLQATDSSAPTLFGSHVTCSARSGSQKRHIHIHTLRSIICRAIFAHLEGAGNF
jgi:hypothetical protein